MFLCVGQVVKPLSAPVREGLCVGQRHSSFWLLAKQPNLVWYKLYCSFEREQWALSEHPYTSALNLCLYTVKLFTSAEQNCSRQGIENDT